MSPNSQSPLDDLPVPCAELLDQILADLNLQNSPKAEEIKALFAAHVKSFAIGRLLQSRYPTVHEDSARARRIAKLITSLQTELEAQNPMINLAMRVSFGEKAGADKSWSDFKNQLDILKSITERFGQTKFAKKQKDEILRHSIGGLMLLLEELTGNRAQVQQRQSDRGIPPKLNSPEARAIAALLKVAQPSLQDTTIVNRIGNIRKEAGDGPLSMFAHQLFLGGVATPH
ncbi:hypothetical protein DFR46_1682 [Parasphingopyxis lamellibrachiae]|uniref:Uncharacterized protein n=2 Tax=Parasphingopyxis lamellibrachiae TaxID=680125 RepID=A0A3D9FHT8_9SPHN|nr:hypothetical protein DFR46_1682 [Parasphingopyxis lamellibrachiae]